LNNDDFERMKAAKSSLQDLENKYNKAIKQNAILENKIEGKSQLIIQVQRLKDELRVGYKQIRQVTDINVRLDQERPNLIQKERGFFCNNPNNFPATALKCARQYLATLLMLKKRINL
ncbi:41125_t:CDS:2, partial [Gigaspora margarita]